ncbi:Piso0_004658 [Millerozyma farinosa CBS 7064]|uniref:Piso0_004658 protein n=1 Tax=Pichia sorbitophila (strain ATCC MYA-4447 / BCRC 22081 / CBS 7064 / NBRC 10061 / NRRL Y-12695) TaxID=559304 RepID=G8Y9E2_PICSO|nr:Piso0_004658 [Millerozyma farinosa CBS 7064]CCE85087.1 Piso0_004658 [Millerozyma farinosa CBS 7064]
MKLRVCEHSIWAVVAIRAATEALASNSTVYLTVTKTVERLASVGGPASNSSASTIQKSSNTGTSPSAVATASSTGGLSSIEAPAKPPDPATSSTEATSSIEEPDEWFPYEDGHLMIGWKKPHKISETTSPAATATPSNPEVSTGPTLTSYSVPFSVTSSAASSDEHFAPIATNDKGNNRTIPNQTKPGEPDNYNNGTAIQSDTVGSNVSYISVWVPSSTHSGEKTSNFHDSGTKDTTSTSKSTDKYTKTPSLPSSTPIESSRRPQRGTPKLSWGTEVETPKVSVSSSGEQSTGPTVSWPGASKEMNSSVHTDESTFRREMPMSRERSESHPYRGTVSDVITQTLTYETTKGPETSTSEPQMPVSSSSLAERPQNGTNSTGSTHPEQVQTPSFKWAGRSSAKSNMWFVPSSSSSQTHPQSTNHSHHLTSSSPQTHQDKSAASVTSTSETESSSSSHETPSSSSSSQPSVSSQTTSSSSVFVSSSASDTDKHSDKSSTAESSTVPQLSTETKSTISPYSLFQNTTEKLNISKSISVVVPENTVKYFSSGSIIEFCYYILVPWITFTFLI